MLGLVVIFLFPQRSLANRRIGNSNGTVINDNIVIMSVYWIILTSLISLLRFQQLNREWKFHIWPSQREESWLGSWWESTTPPDLRWSSIHSEVLPIKIVFLQPSYLSLPFSGVLRVYTWAALVPKYTDTHRPIRISRFLTDMIHCKDFLSWALRRHRKLLNAHAKIAAVNQPYIYNTVLAKKLPQ